MNLAKSQIKTEYSNDALLPTEIRNLVEKRQRVKKEMKRDNLDALTYMHLNIEQQALKITANSIYGCLGFKHSRFFAKKMAQMITKTGRDALLTAKNQAEKVFIFFLCKLNILFSSILMSFMKIPTL